jgi:hypothetical protein
MTSTSVYTISFFQDSRSAGGETYRGALDMAKAIAIATVQKGSAGQAEIHGPDQKLLFRYPLAPRGL